MIVITGGAGFIGSALAWGLNRRNIEDILIVDELGTSEKWKNLVALRYSDYMDKDAFIEKLEQGGFGNAIDAIFHLGACSSTTETNAAYLMENNYQYTQRLGYWHESHRRTRLIYASSAATYGNGDQGYSDVEKELDTLKPLNMYGYSKHLFDLFARRKGWLSHTVGIKYFNVFGPNEEHKADMRSVISKAYPHVRDTGTMSLFKSYHDGYADGEQRRDFVYIKDAVAMTLFFYDNRDVNGIFNVGNGVARSWNDVAHAMFKAVGCKGSINYIPMPETLREKYQYYTCADMKKLHNAGYHQPCMILDDAIKDYITNYLSRDALLGQEK